MLTEVRTNTPEVVSWYPVWLVAPEEIVTKPIDRKSLWEAYSHDNSPTRGDLITWLKNNQHISGLSPQAERNLKRSYGMWNYHQKIKQFRQEYPTKSYLEVRRFNASHTSKKNNEAVQKLNIDQNTVRQDAFTRTETELDLADPDEFVPVPESDRTEIELPLPSSEDRIIYDSSKLKIQA